MDPNRNNGSRFVEHSNRGPRPVLLQPLYNNIEQNPNPNPSLRSDTSNQYSSGGRVRGNSGPPMPQQRRNNGWNNNGPPPSHGNDRQHSHHSHHPHHPHHPPPSHHPRPHPSQQMSMDSGRRYSDHGDDRYGSGGRLPRQSPPPPTGPPPSEMFGRQRPPPPPRD